MQKLISAVEEGDFVTLKQIIESNKEDPTILKTCDSSSNSLLHLAIKGDHAECVKYLLDLGVPLTITNTLGQTPLHLAAALDSTKCLELILRGNSKPDRVAGLIAKTRALSVSLKKAGSNPTIKKNAKNPSPRDGKMLDASLKGGNNNAISKSHVDINIHNSVGSTPLHSAAASGSLSTLKILLENGADVNKKDKYGNTPLHKAVYEDHLSVASILIQNRADLDIQNNDGDTILHKAVDRCHSRFVSLLLESGANATLENKKGLQPIHIAASRVHLETTKLLLENGIDVNTHNSNNQTPLHLAALASNSTPNFSGIGGINSLSNMGMQSVSGSSNNDHPLGEYILHLIDKGGDVHLKDNKGKTPVEYVGIGVGIAFLFDPEEVKKRREQERKRREDEARRKREEEERRIEEERRKEEKRKEEEEERKRQEAEKRRIEEEQRKLKEEEERKKAEEEALLKAKRKKKKKKKKNNPAALSRLYPTVKPKPQEATPSKAGSPTKSSSSSSPSKK